MQAGLENYQNCKKKQYFQSYQCLVIYVVQYECDATKLCGIRLSKKEW